MQHLAPLTIVQEWQDAANAQNIERLLELSAPNIEIVGPRGSGFGHQLLRDWMARAGLTLKTLSVFVRGEKVVVEQHGAWRSQETGEVTGEKTLASAFQVDDRHVVKFARYDDLDTAFEVTGLRQFDEA